MTTISEIKTPYSHQIVIEADFSKHVASMRLAASTKQSQVTHTIAKASLEEIQGKETPKTEKLTTREKFFRDIYAAVDDDKKAKVILKEIQDAHTPTQAILKEKGFKGLEFETFDKGANPRAYNLSMLEK